jgi:hypothetical protein
MSAPAARQQLDIEFNLAIMALRAGIGGIGHG